MPPPESLMLTTWSLEQVYEDGVLVDNSDYKVYMAMAADVNGKNGVEMYDYILIKRHVMGTYVIKDPS